MTVTPFDIAHRFIGVKETPGSGDNPLILAMLRLDMAWPEGDSVPWCSAFVNAVAWLLGLERSRSLRARSWLKVGAEVAFEGATVGHDVVVLSRGANAPGPEVIEAPGHVGFFAGWETPDRTAVRVLGGNQSDSVSVAIFPAARILGIRRITAEAL